jgi:Tol biopolymer transport system component
MKTKVSGSIRLVSLALLGFLPCSALASPLQPVTVLSSQLSPAAGGNGDSVAPVVSADGRYVVFASAANNLPVNGSNYLALMPAQLNVFVRDRASRSTTLVSINAAATGGGNDDSMPRGISTNGQFVLFESAASNLVAGFTNNVNTVFVRDLVHGVTLLASIGLNGAPASGASHNSVMTPDGRYVAFSSDATNLVSGDTNGVADVFVRDLQMGVTILASVGATSNSLAIGGGASDLPAISSDGRYAAFYSTATNLAPGVQTVGEVYLRDLIGGETTAVSTAAHALVQSLLGASNVFSCSPAMSTNGQIVAYEACQTTGYGAPASAPGVILSYNVQTGSTDIVNTNALAVTFGSERGFRGFEMTPDGQFIALVAGVSDTSGANTAVEVWSAQSGAATPASVDVNSSPVTNGISDQPVMDSSGRYTAFLSGATNLTTNTVVSGFHLYIRDLQAGVTTLIDADTNGVGSITNLIPFWSLSADGSVIAFAAWDGELVANDSNHACDVFARDLASNSVELISVRQPALPAMAADGPSAITNVSVSANGRFVAFTSLADNLVPGYANGAAQVFVRDLVGGATTLVSVHTNGILPGNGASMGGAISADGRYVLFTSAASDLVAGDTNSATDVFVRDLQLGTTALVSVNTNGTGPGNGASYAPMMSSDGRYVLFHSVAGDLAAGAFPSGATESVFWRDLQLGITRAVVDVAGAYEPNNYYSACMTPDGQNVAWSFSTGSPLFIWNAQADGNTFTNSTVKGAHIVAISADGTRVAAYAGVLGEPTSFTVVDSSGQTNLTFPSSTFAHPGAQFSSDGRYLAYVFGSPPNQNQIYLYDFQTGSNLLVSASINGQGGANGRSDSLAISPDGRFVAYRSFASNLTPGDYNGAPDVFLYDQVTGATKLVSASQFGSASANGPSLMPVFSGDSQAMFFQSWASDLLGGFFKSSGQVWALSLYSTNLPPAFRTSVGPASAPGQGPTLLWSVMPGKSYQVQFKNELSDPAWQPLMSGLTIVGNQGYFNDPAPPAGHRFYRIVSF